MGQSILQGNGGDTSKYVSKLVFSGGKGAGGGSGGHSWTADKDYDYGYAIFSCYKGGGAGCNANNGAVVVATGNVHTTHDSGGAGNRTQSWFISNIKKGTTISWGWKEDWQSSQAILVMLDKA